MLFDVKKNKDTSIICECHKCGNVATNELILCSSVSIYICDKCLDSIESSLDDEFDFNVVNK